MKMLPPILVVFMMALVSACNVLPWADQPGASTSIPVSSTVSPVQITETPTPTTTVPATSTPQVLQPVVDTPTPTLTATPTATATPRPAYVLQPGSPIGLPNFQESTCNWMGVGGQVFGTNNEPVMELVVELGGSLNAQPVSLVGLTGSTALLGPGSYLIQVSSVPAASDGTLWVRIKDLTGRWLSDQIYFTTYADCEHNLILINFSALAEPVTPRLYLPFVLRNYP